MKGTIRFHSEHEWPIEILEVEGDRFTVAKLMVTLKSKVSCSCCTPIFVSEDGCKSWFDKQGYACGEIFWAYRDLP